MAGRYGSDTQAPGARLAKRVQAVFAINGDYFNFTSNGYVVRQGTLYRTTRPRAAISCSSTIRATSILYRTPPPKSWRPLTAP